MVDGRIEEEETVERPDLEVRGERRYIATNFLGHGTVNPKANESDD